MKTKKWIQYSTIAALSTVFCLTFHTFIQKTDAFVEEKLVSYGDKSYYLRSDGTLIGWGSGDYCSIGDKINTNRTTMVETVLKNVIDVDTGGNHAIGLTSDGIAYTWGRNIEGQLGNGRTYNTECTPQIIDGIGKIIDVAAGNNHSIALTEDGRVWTWGYNSVGQIGDGTNVNKDRPTLIDGLDHVSAVFGGGDMSGVIKQDGTVWMWGTNGNGQAGSNASGTRQYTPVQIPQLSDVKTMTMGSNFVMALKKDGTLWAWGANNDYQLGVGGSTANKTIPVQVGGWTNVAKIAAGSIHAMAILEDGRTFIWGNNRMGQLGTGESEINVRKMTPYEITYPSNIDLIEGGNYHTIVKTKNGKFYGWGSNHYGQIGDGRLSTQLSIQTIPITNIQTIAAGQDSSYVLKTDGTVWGWGRGWEGQNGTNNHIAVPRQIAGLSSITKLVAGGQHAVAIKSDGTLWSWGHGGYGTNGVGNTSNYNTPVQVKNLSDVVDVAAGYYHTIALKSDGTVWVWGYSYSGQTGQSTNPNVTLPMQMTGLSGIVDVEAGLYHNIALKSDGTVITWGSNGYGEIGDGTTTNRSSYYTIPEIKNAVKIYTTGYNTFVKTADNTVWAWGRNLEGEVGDGGTANRLKPVKVTGLVNPKYINGRHTHMLALDQNDEVWGWGYNSFGQLGLEDSYYRQTTPLKLSVFGKVKDIAGGGNFSLVLKQDGTLLSVGDNGYGQIGNGVQYGYQPSPVEAINLWEEYGNFSIENTIVQIPHHSSQNVGNVMTIEAIIRPTTTGTLQRIVEKKDQYIVALDQGEVKWSFMTNGNWEWRKTGIFIPANQWSHLALTYDGTNVRLYYNGDLKLTQADITGGALTPSTQDVFIGVSSTKTNYYKGFIKEVRLWNSVRTAGEIKTYLNDGLIGNENGLQGWWSFDNVTNDKVYDLTGHAAPGDILGMNVIPTSLTASDVTESSATLNWNPVKNASTYTLLRDRLEIYSGSSTSFVDSSVTSGKAYTYTIVVKNKNGESIGSSYTLNAPGNSLSFDGTNDYMEVKETPTLKPTDQMTIETWIKPMFYGRSTSKKVLTGDTTSSNVFTYSNASGSYTGPVWFEYRNNGQLDVYFRNTSDVSLTARIPYVPVDKWSHVAATYNKTTGTAKIYLDGSLTASTTNASFGNLKSGKNIWFGTGKGSSNAYYYNGEIAEVRMWNIERPLSDIQRDMYSVLNGNETGLTGLWFLDSFTNAKSFDKTEAKNHATSVGMDKSPVDLQIKDITSTTATLWWSSVERATQYELRRDGNPIYSGSGTSFEDITRVNGKRYTYSVVARSPKGESLPSTLVAPPSYAVTLDGLNDYVDYNTAFTDLTGPKTFEFWINPMKNASSMLFALKKEDTPNANLTFVDDNSGSGALRFFQNGIELGRVEGVLSYDRWQHIAITDNGTAITVYKNGDLVGSFTGTFSFSSISAPKRFLVAHGYHSSAEQWYKNTLSEFRVWNKALSQPDIQNRMNQELQGTEEGLIGYYQFDENTTGKIFDHTSNHYDGMMYGFTNLKTNLKVANTTNTTATLMWNPIPNVSSYKLSRDGSMLYQGTNTSFTDTAVDSSVRYRYSLTAVGENGESLYDSLTLNPPSNQLLFDGGDYVDAGNLSTLPNDKVSIEFWMKTKEKTGTYAPLAKSPKANNDWAIVLKEGYIGIEGRDGTTTTHKTAQNRTFVANDQWHHVTATINGSVWRLYIDGELEVEYDTKNSTPNIKNDVSFFLGAKSDGTLRYKGSLSDTRVYTRSLSASEIRNHYKGTYEDESGLVAWYRPSATTTSILYNLVGGSSGIGTGFSPPDIHLKGIVLTTNSINIDWDDTPDVTEYELKRGNTVIYRGTTSTFVDANLQTGSLYNYTLNVKTDKGESGEIPLTVSTAVDYLVFDGVDDQIDMQDLSTLKNSFTYEMWVNPLTTHEIDSQSATGTGGTSGQRYVIGPKNGGSTGEAGIGISIGTNGVSVYEQATSHMPPLLVYQGNITKMTHVAVVIDNKVPKLYLDGVLVKTGVTSTKIPVASSSIGYNTYGKFFGQLDNVSIWKTARTQNEIQTTMQSGVNPTDPSLAGYWDVDELTTGKIYDLTGKENNGMANGFTPANTLETQKANESSAKIKWAVIKSALTYELKRNGNTVYTGTQTEFIDTGLFEDTMYTYTLVGKNTRGESIGFPITIKTKKNPEKSLAFNGTTQYGLKQGFTKLNLNAGITMEFWVKTTSFDDSILSYSSPGSIDEMVIYDSSSLKFRHGTTELNSGITINDGQWHHMAITWRWSDGRIRIFENGSLAYESTALPDWDAPDPVGNLVVGGRQTDSNGKVDSSTLFKGELAEIRFWGSERTEQDIQQDMNKRLSGAENSLSVLWQPSSFTTGKVYDKTLNMDHLILKGYPLKQTLQPTFISSSRIDLEWTSVSNASAYDLKRDGSTLLSGTDRLLQENGLLPETMYTYELVAKDDDGETPIVRQLITTLPSELSISETPTIDSLPGVILNGEQQILSTDITGKLQISDFTDTGSGWHITVQAAPFKEKTPYGGFANGTKPLLLPSGSITLRRPNPITPVAGTTSPNPTLSSGSSWVLDSTNATLLLSAAEQEGMGSYNLTFPSKAFVVTLQPTDIRIDDTNYPSSSTPFSSVVTWTVNVGP